jgi:hypothetical protein
VVVLVERKTSDTELRRPLLPYSAVRLLIPHGNVSLSIKFDQSRLHNCLRLDWLVAQTQFQDGP